MLLAVIVGVLGGLMSAARWEVAAVPVLRPLNAAAADDESFSMPDGAIPQRKSPESLRAPDVR